MQIVSLENLRYWCPQNTTTNIQKEKPDRPDINCASMYNQNKLNNKETTSRKESIEVFFKEYLRNIKNINKKQNVKIL